MNYIHFFHAGRNLAREGTASQDSESYPASNAIDGEISG